MKANGTQIIAEFSGCNSNLLNDEEKLKELITKIGKIYKLDIRQTLSKFDPFGITIVAIVAKSHVAIHTYPEDKHVSIDIFTCSGNPMKIFQGMKALFKPTSSTHMTLVRNKNITIIDSDWTSGDDQPVEGYRDEYHIKEKLESYKSKHQKILVIDNESFGKMLFLDGELQIAEKGQHVYDTSLINCIPNQNKKKIKTIMIFGGGDGGITNQALKSLPNVEKIDLVELDEEVIKVSKKHFPGVCGTAFEDKRVNIIIDDAFNHLDGCCADGIKYDAMFVDLTDMANRELNVNLDRILDKIANTLNVEGYLIMQSGSVYDRNSQIIIKEALINKFRNVTEKKVWIPAYGSLWSFMSSRK